MFAQTGRFLEFSQNPRKKFLPAPYSHSFRKRESHEKGSSVQPRSWVASLKYDPFETTKSQWRQILRAFRFSTRVATTGDVWGVVVMVGKMWGDGLGLLVRLGVSNLFLDDWGDGFHFFGHPGLWGNSLQFDEDTVAGPVLGAHLWWGPKVRLESPTSCNMTWAIKKNPALFGIYIEDYTIHL